MALSKKISRSKDIYLFNGDTGSLSLHQLSLAAASRGCFPVVV